MKKVFLLSLLIIICFATFAQHGGGKEKGKDHKGYNVWADINLTPQQRTRIDSLRTQLRDEEKPDFQQIKSIRKQIADELLKVNPDSSVLHSYAQQLGAVNANIAQKWISHLQKLKPVLAPDQYSKLIQHGLEKMPFDPDTGAVK